MGRKVFISFLGTNNYKECVYVSKSLGESSVVTYVQDAILQIVSKNWSSNDKAYIFLTQGAKEKHWNRLQDVLNEYQYPFEIEPVFPIHEGYSEDEIWSIFRKVYEKLDYRDEIFLDITHGFRSLPMLSMVLLEYAKTLKRITVSKIFYGAFEALGEAYKIEQIYPNPIDRKTPLLELTAFSQLQEWAIATSDFIEFGNAKKLIHTLKFSDFSSSNHSKSARGNIKKVLTLFAQNLQALTGMYATNRGQEIIEAQVHQAIFDSLETLETYSRELPKLSPLTELLEKIKFRVNGYQENDVRNGIIAAEWCLNSNLIQQGITLLQEFIITICLNQIEFDYQNRLYRVICSALLGKDNRTPYEFKSNDSDEVDRSLELSLIDKIEQLPYYDQIKEIYNDLGAQHRNDIQHAGFSHKTPKESSEFSKCLERNLKKIKAIDFSYL